MDKKVFFPHATSTLGGSKNSSFLICEHLKKQGYRPIQIFPYPGSAVDRANSLGLKTIVFHKNVSVNKLKNTRGILKKLESLPYLLVEFYHSFRITFEMKPAAVHLNDDISMFTWGLSAKILGIPIIWHVRQERGNPHLDWAREKIADQIIYVAEAIKKRLAHTKNKTKSCVIYNGVDTKTFYPDEKITRDKIKIAFIGNLVHRKRPEWVAHACADLINKNYNIEAIFVGEDYSDGNYTQILKKISLDSKNPERFFFLGFRNDTPDILRNIDILILPSEQYGEAFPRVILEAMASGVCVVATNVSGIPEMIKNNENGYLVPHDNFHALRDKLIDLVENPQKMRSIKIKARENIEVNFRSEETLKNIDEVYESLCHHLKT
jgi:glycosyltransferase involved in cell wall biosynthesis